MQKSCFWLNSCLLLLLTFFSLQASLNAQSSQNHPPLPCDFYGGEEITGALTPGKIITARDSDGVIIGQANVTESGQYGFLTCSGDINGTVEDEGAVNSDIVTFYLNGTKQRQQAVWKSGEAIKVDLGIVAESGAFNLHLLDIAGYTNYNNDPRYSGTAVADMILDYLDEANADTQPDLMNYADTNHNLENESSELERLLNVKAPAAYNFGSTAVLETYANRGIINSFNPRSQADCLKQICHWISYQVPHTVQNKQYVPVAIATSANPAQNADSDWQHWMSLVGIRANQDPFPSLSDYAGFREVYDVPASIQLYGVYLNDPGQNGLGAHTYMAADVFTRQYFRPISAGLTQEGYYIAILEPPAPEANPITVKPPAASADLEIILKNPQREVSFFVPGWLNPAVKNYLLGIFEQLKDSFDFSGLLDDAYFSQSLQEAEVSRIFKVEAKDGPDYTIIPFEKKIDENLATTAAIIINNQTGQFEIAFGSQDASGFFKPLAWPQAYKALRKTIGWQDKYLVNRWLYYSQGNALYPGWKAVTVGYSQSQGVILANSFGYVISPQGEANLESESAAVEVISRRSYRKGDNYLALVIFDVAHSGKYNLSIEDKGSSSKAYLYNNGSNQWLAVLEGKHEPYCRIKITQESSSGNIRQGGVTYMYIPG